MTLPELYTALKTLGMPIAYGEFEVTPQTPAPAPPFITYQVADNADVMADNINYVDVGNVQIELYTTRKDLAREKLVQDKLKTLGLAYGKFETRLEDERLYQIVYTVQLIGG